MNQELLLKNIFWLVKKKWMNHIGNCHNVRWLRTLLLNFSPHLLFPENCARRRYSTWSRWLRWTPSQPPPPEVRVSLGAKSTGVWVWPASKLVGTGLDRILNQSDRFLNRSEPVWPVSKLVGIGPGRTLNPFWLPNGTTAATTTRAIVSLCYAVVEELFSVILLDVSIWCRTEGRVMKLRKKSRRFSLLSLDYEK